MSAALRGALTLAFLAAVLGCGTLFAVPRQFPVPRRHAAAPRSEEAPLAIATSAGAPLFSLVGLVGAGLAAAAAAGLARCAAVKQGVSCAGGVGLLAGTPRSTRVARRALPQSTAVVDLSGKVALVTGASRGIGEAIANRLAQAGATVIGTATSDKGAEAISVRFTGQLKGKGVKLDVSKPKDVEKVLEAIEKEHGVPDILVNNAGITKDGLMLRMKEEDWLAVINTNLSSVYRLSKAVLKGMTKKRWGRIISISSVVGSMGNAGQANYAAAKAGVNGFSRALAKEVGGRGVTVNTVAPGFIKTDMTDGLKEEWKAKLLEAVPAGRLGTPEEIADAVLFLASPGASYITGQVLHVNGGMYM